MVRLLRNTSQIISALTSQADVARFGVGAGVIVGLLVGAGVGTLGADGAPPFCFEANHNKKHE